MFDRLDDILIHYEELMQELEARDISYLFGDNDDETA